MKRLFSLTLAALLTAGCGADERLAPVAVDAGAPKDAGDDAAPPPVPDAGTVKRTVMERNPFGGPAGNQLADGDFEFSTLSYAGAQTGWRAFTGDGSTPLVLATETGGLCRSGLRCAVLPSSTVLLIRGTSANGKANLASAWAKVPAGATCSMVRPILITCDTFAIGKQLLAKKADAEGWCHYTAAINQSDLATCIYVDNTLPKDTTALLDNFVLGPDDGTVPLEAEFWVPDAETSARLAAIRDYEIAHMPFGRRPRRPPPTP